jgi:hypothetical protein
LCPDLAPGVEVRALVECLPAWGVKDVGIRTT